MGFPHLGQVWSVVSVPFGPTRLRAASGTFPFRHRAIATGLAQAPEGSKVYVGKAYRRYSAGSRDDSTPGCFVVSADVVPPAGPAPQLGVRGRVIVREESALLDVGLDGEVRDDADIADGERLLGPLHDDPRLRPDRRSQKLADESRGGAGRMSSLCHTGGGSRHDV